MGLQTLMVSVDVSTSVWNVNRPPKPDPGVTKAALPEMFWAAGVGSMSLLAHSPGSIDAKFRLAVPE